MYATFIHFVYSGQSPTLGLCSSAIGIVEVRGIHVKGRVSPYNYPRNLHHDINLFSSGSSHLQDLKEITHDFLYENYRTEKLSRTVNNGESEQVLVYTYRVYDFM